MRRQVISFMLLLTAMSAIASPITEEAAEQKARQFLSERQPQNARRMIRAAKDAHALRPVSTEPLYYVFNVGEANGFVIVSGDDRTEPILGYADAGSFDEQALPENVRAWLKGYVDQMIWQETYRDASTASGGFAAEDPSAGKQRGPRKIIAK